MKVLNIKICIQIIFHSLAHLQNFIHTNAINHVICRVIENGVINLLDGCVVKSQILTEKFTGLCDVPTFVVNTKVCAAVEIEGHFHVKRTIEIRHIFIKSAISIGEGLYIGSPSFYITEAFIDCTNRVRIRIIIVGHLIHMSRISFMSHRWHQFIIYIVPEI